MKRFLAAPLAACALACAVLLGGCGGPAPEELIRTDLTAEFDAISAENEELTDLIEESSGGAFELLDISPEEFAKGCFGDFSYEIGDIEADEKEGIASAEVTIKMKSFTDILAKFQEEYQAWISSIDPAAAPTEDEIYAKGGEILMSVMSETPAEETDAILDYSKNEDGDWELDGDGAEDAVLDAMF